MTGAALAYQHITGCRTNREQTPLVQMEPVSQNSLPERVERAGVTNVTEAGTTPLAASGFSWSQVESSDYRQYVANLRAIGCPESEVRDICMAESKLNWNGWLLKPLARRDMPWQRGSWRSCQGSEVIQAPQGNN